ncbi:mucin-binding protein [Lactobacillus amylovorus]|uniref:mucin-binding protein n=1 Tax=Lactobacillus amylovorus TaxID=1604 RepID=UPI0021C7281B|nr:MucBP domain-containing protein [Lactobacillus amylovorus]UXN11190.1 MucBP domain-containing protein [Lactobacillus amylovorus]
MNNRRNLKENLTISNKQRFSIRKFSIGVASVMLGTTLYFMGGVGTSIVHADSVQGQSVQTSNLDTNSAQASSDTSSAEQTSSQNQTSSAQNSQKAVSNASANTKSTDSKTQTSDQVANATTDKKSASQADNASVTNSKTQDNKKVVSDANRAKSTANDAQTKSAQQIAKSNAANSNKLVVQQTLKLTGNAKLNKLADSKAQTDTKTDSNYSVTDNYPEGLMNYLPRDFNNTQEYAFEWLRNERKNNIILTTNRTGDGVVHVYQDGKEVDTLARNSLYPLPLYDNIWGDEIGTVYNDDYAGIVQSNGLNIIYSSHAKDVDNAGSSYSTVSFFVPHKITQTVTYKDSDGKVIKGLTHTQDGLTGQSYTTGLPSGSDYVRKGEKGEVEYLDNITNNSSGLISEFHDGYTCTKDYHDGVSVTFTEKDSDGIGAMDYVIYDGGWVAQWGSLAYGQSTNYTNGSGRYTIVNPYVPQTTNIVYQYKKLGQVITTDPSGNKTRVYYTVYYTNDQSDPIKSEPVNAKPITGYSAIVKYENKIVSDKNFMPKNLGENTYITYVADAQKATINYIDDTAGKTLHSETVNGHTGEAIADPTEAIANYKKQGYQLASDDLAKGASFDNDDKTDQAFYIHLNHNIETINPDNPKTPSDIIPGTTKHYPSGVDKESLTKTVTRTINVISPDGKTTTIKQPVTLQRSATVDDVTGQITYKPWSTDKWAEYDTPSISGYTPSQAKVSATTVDGNTQDKTVTITYSADAQKATINYIDDTAGKTLHSETVNGHTGEAIADPTEAIANYKKQGYQLASDDLAKGASFDNDDKTDQAFYIHLNHNIETINPDNPKTPSDIIPGTTKHYPSGVDKESLTKTVTRTINVISPDGKTTTIKQPVTLQRSATVDDVTGQITYKPWSTDKWAEYDTPSISGYTPSQAKVSATTVDGNTQDKTVTITYSADAQKATINYIDDTAGKTLHSETVNGHTGEAIADPTEAIANYKKQGYQLASDDLAKGASFDNDDKTDQAFYIHLNHNIETINPDNPKTPSDIIPGTTKHYPSGVDKESLTKTVTRTINVISPDGKTTTIKQPVTLQRSATVDDVTGQITYKPWSTDKWAEYDTPSISGYTPSQAKVSATTVDGNTQDKTVTITYSADAQKATINYIDDTAGKTLHSETVNGHTGEAIADPTEAIANYKKQGYQLASDDLAKGASFDNDDKTDQAFYIHLNHNIETINPDNPKTPSDIIPGTTKHYPSGVDKESLTKTVTRTINVISPDGKTTTIKQPVTLQRSATVDDVTGQITYKPWSTDKWAEYDTPSISGYTPSQAKVSATTVDGNTQDKTVTITYSADAQKATINYIDDTAGKTLHSETVNGHTGEAIADPTEAIANYKKQGYQLASDDLAKGASFDNDDKTDQAFYIHLNHNIETINPDNPKTPSDIIPGTTKHYPSGVDKESLTKTVTRTINVISPDGKTTTIKQPVTLQRSATVDDVTGQITYKPWSTDKWAEYDTPSISGYTPSQAKVSATTVDGNTQDKTVTITYSADAQKATINYIDDTAGKTLHSETVNGHTGEAIADPTEAIANYKKQGYQLASDDLAKGASFDNDDKTDQAFYIHLNHNIETINPDNPKTPSDIIPGTTKHYPSGVDKESLTKTVTRTINVISPDGKTTTIKQPVTLQRSATVDDVTGQITYKPWSTDKWAEYDTPSISGYTPSQAKVSATTVDGNTQDKTVTITYSADAQKATINYIDDTAGKTLHSETVNGHTGEAIADPTEAIANYKKQGYQLASDDLAKGASFDNDDKTDQAFYIHLNHNIETINPDNPKTPSDIIPGTTKHYPSGVDKESLTKTVTRTINVISPDGKTTTIKQPVTLQRSATVDDVTGQITYKPWSTDKWAEYDTPSISGYTPSQAKVSATTVDGNTQDKTVTITYSADAQKATINYIDDTAGKTLHSETVNGHTGEAIADPTEAIANYKKQGYQLASDDLAKGASFDNDDKTDQAFYIHLNHNIETINPDNPKTPSDIIPGTTKHYPSGVDKESLTKTVTRTINVISPDGKTTTIKQPVTLQRSATVDDVTGQITYKPWSTDKWAEYDTPSISGYTPSQAKVSATTVDGNTQDKTVTITYSADAQKATINYIDDTAGKTLHSETVNGHTGEAIADPTEAIANYKKQGYQLASDDLAKGASFDNDDKTDQAFYIHLNHNIETINPDNPKTPSDIIPGTTKHYPSGVDKESLTKTVTRTINVISPDGKTTTIKQPVTLQRSATVDDVTGQITYKPWSTDKWAEYDTPSISGYTPSQAKVSATTVDGNTQDKTVTITYSADAQKATINYIDDTAGKTLHSETVNGHTGEAIADPTEAIANYKKQGYQLASDDLAKGASFDNDDKTDQAFYIHLNHNIETINPDNPKTPSDIIPGTTKHYPSGVDKESLTKTVTRTINVISPDGKTTTIKQPVTLQRSATVDDVTGQITYKPWSTDKWAEYDTPSISGYTPSQAKVSATTVDGNTQDKTVTITYSADAQKATINYIDDTAGKTLHSETVNGHTGEAIADPTEAIANYKKQGYQLASDDLAKGASFDNDDKTDQAFYIHLNHNIETINPDNPKTPSDIIPGTTKHYPSGVDKESLTKTVTRTINVISPDGKTTTIKQPVTLQRSATVDDVTGQITYKPWSTDKWAEYDTPSISGYTPSQAKVSATTVDGNTQDKTVTITYSADAQKATINYIDDTAGKTLHSETVNGHTGEAIADPTEAIANYKKQGYQLASDDLAKGASFDNDDKTDQAFYIHLNHNIETINPDNPKTPSDIIPGTTKHYPSGVDKESLTKTVTRTINVISPDGKTTTIKQPVTLQRSATVDDVTGQITYKPWSTDKWAEYDTPSISGYTPSQAKVSATTVDGNTQDKTVTITYSADAQKATINYIDDTAGKTLHSETVNGHTGEAIADPTEAIANYKKQGYQLASDDLAKGASFDNDDKTDQAFYIHLNHNIETINPDNPKTPSDIIPGTTKHYPSGVDKESLTKTVTRTINVISPDGKTTTIKQPVTLQRSATVDDVTGQITYKPWSTDKWAEYDTPSISGYTPSQAKVSATTVDGNTQDKTVTITYSADAQKATINYIDDTAGKTLHSETVNGHTGEAIADPTEAIANYKKQGYQLASDDLAKGASFDNDDKTDQAFYIHLNHNIETINPDNPKTPSDIIPGTTKHYPSGVDKESLTKTVTRTINVISPDGKTTTIKQPVTLQRSATVDDVTGQITYKPWSTDKWAEYDTPSISGYTPSQAKVSATTVDGNTQDKTVTITYSADAQKATINYIDDTAGKTLHSETVNGHTGEAIADPTEAIANYKKQGYQLASDDLAKGASFDNDDKTDQAFYIHLNHNIETINPDNPKTPSDIIPGTTKHYPSGVDKESLTKTITRTINYVDNKGNKVNGSPDGKSTYVQTVTFTRTVTIDKVTGDIKSSTPWVPANGTWSQVNSRDPHELGYDSVDISTVGSKVVTSSSKDETITVTYSKDGGAPTPTPEPNPDPNPQPQPSDPRNVPAPSTPTSHPTQPTNNKKDDENKDNNSNPKKRRNPNKTTVKTGSTRNNHPKINNNTSAKVANGKTSKAAKTLPQTGENNKFGLIGLLFAALGVVFGLAGDRKRKN